MSSSENVSSDRERAGEVTLAIRTGDRSTEIFVVDGAYRLAARGLGSLRASLPAGLYKVKLQCGAHVQEAFLELVPGQEALVGECPNARLERRDDGVELIASPLRFSSAVPLDHTRLTHEYQLAAAAEHSRKVHARLGQGSQIFLFARSWSSEESKARGTARTPPRLSLHDASDKLLLELERDGARDPGAADPWLACNVEVEPGVYRLRLTTPGHGALESAVVALPGWQLQVFFCQLFGQGQGPGERPSLASAASILRPMGRGFDPRDPDLRLTELARTSLRSRRLVLEPELLERVLHNDDDPMLSIYGGHLLLLREPPDLGLLRQVVTHLRGLLPPQPDVEALALAAGMEPVDPDVFGVPPMLSRSWPYIVKATAKRPDLVPRRSLAARVAERLYGEGTWLIWRQPEKPKDAPRPTPGETARVFAAPLGVPPPPEEGLARVLERLRRMDPARLEALEALDGLEGALASQLATALGTEEKLRKSGSRHRRVGPLTPEGLVRTLAVPMAALDAAARKLAARLEPVPA
jgi:hypothetical protein